MINTGAMPAQHFSGVSHRLRWSRQTDHDFAGAVSPRVSALWARRRFMTSCVVSESTPMSRPPGLTHNWSVTPANTLC
jgi:hypothetical protein